MAEGRMPPAWVVLSVFEFGFWFWFWEIGWDCWNVVAVVEGEEGGWKLSNTRSPPIGKFALGHTAFDDRP